MAQEAAVKAVEKAGDVADQLVSKGFALLEQLAAKIGVTVDYLWPFMVREHVVEWFTCLLMTVVCSLMTILTFKRVDERLFKDFANCEYPARSITLFAVSLILVVAAFIGFCGIWVKFDGFLNPEYYAMKDLIHIVR